MHKQCTLNIISMPRSQFHGYDANNTPVDRSHHLLPRYFMKLSQF